MGESRNQNQKIALADTRAGQLTSALLLLATVTYPLGLLLPALETSQLAFWRYEYSILGFGLALMDAEEWLLAILVLGFSVAFPGLKLAWMWRLQLQKQGTPTPPQMRILENLGKWSMGDVLVIALIVFSFKGNVVFTAQPLPGVWVFAVSTLIAMLASGRISKQLTSPDR